jgi:hypothetical protein
VIAASAQRPGPTLSGEAMTDGAQAEDGAAADDDLGEQMHVHRPRPLHGWREFLREYAIIVLGVLTALALEQAVEWAHLHERVGQARERLVSEIQHQYLVDEEYLAVQPCLERQLNRIEQAVLNSGATLSPLPANADARAHRLSLVYSAPSRSWTDSAWQGAIAEGLTSRFSPTERRLLPIHYAQMGSMRVLAQQEDTAVGQLLALSKPLPMDGRTKADYVGIIEQERLRSGKMAVFARQMNRDIATLGYTPDMASRRAWLGASGTVALCRSIPAG